MECLIRLVQKWINQIEQVLNQSEQVRQESDDIGPSAEMAYWRSRLIRYTKLVD